MKAYSTVLQIRSSLVIGGCAISDFSNWAIFLNLKSLRFVWVEFYENYSYCGLSLIENV